MKKFKTFILAFAVLWAFFYTIYANIKTNEVYELEDQNSELQETAIDMHERAEQEAMRARVAETEVNRLQAELELCETGN